LGTLSRKRGEIIQATEWLEQARLGFTEVDDREGIANVLKERGTLAIQQGEYDQARKFYWSSLEIYRTLHSKKLIGNLLSNLGILARMQTEYDNAESLYQEALTLRREIGDERDRRSDVRADEGRVMDPSRRRRRPLALRPDQVQVINEGVNIEEFRAPKDIQKVLYKYAIPPNFLFFPAQLWLHKNHLTVLTTLLKLHKEGLTIPLVLTGAQYSSAQLVFNFIKENNMHYVYYLGKVPFDDLVALYQTARFMITAVLYESSSLPVLEAAAAGTAIIASNTPPNVELSRRLKINLFDPYNADNLAHLLRNIWDNTELIAGQKAYNREQIQQFSWENIAKQYVALFEKIVQTQKQKQRI
jgi:glycosyltransferase involved in cell wall biosynthesis